MFDFTQLESIDSDKASSKVLFNPNVYPKLILQENMPEHISFLVDWLRGMKLATHWNSETKRNELCNKKMYRRKCEVCESGDKLRPEILKIFPVYAHSREGKKRDKDRKGNPFKDKEGNLISYEEEVIYIYEQKYGTGGENHVVLQDANATYTEGVMSDHFAYYKKVIKNGVETLVLEPATLLENRLLFTDRGEDKIWEIKKKNEGRISYPPPNAPDLAILKKKLGSQIHYRVPKVVREHFNTKTIDDLAPFYLYYYGNVDYEFFQIEPPKEGDKFILNKTTVDANTSL